jgi:hypothetical protein
VTLACGREVSPAAQAALPPVPPPPAPGDPACPRDGTWKGCALEDRVKKAGLYFKATDDTMHVTFLKAPGVRYQLGLTAALVAFYYADSTSAALDISALDQRRLVPKGDTAGPWKSMPSDVIQSANLIAVLLDAKQLQIERVRRVITAGAPQPASTPPMQPVPQALPPAPPAR